MQKQGCLNEKEEVNYSNENSDQQKKHQHIQQKQEPVQQDKKPQTQQSQSKQHDNNVDDDQITPETLAHFNKICQDATQLMHSYQEQSQQLKQEISGMVNVYAKSTESTGNAVPVDKIMQITQEYQVGMRQANAEYTELSEGLRQEEKERDQMILQIQECFGKLELMEKRMKEKKLLKEGNVEGKVKEKVEVVKIEQNEQKQEQKQEQQKENKKE